MRKNLIGLCCILLSLLCVCLSACGDTPDLYQTGIEITTLMEEMVYSDAYLNLHGLNNSIYDFDYLRAKDYDTPTRVYKLSAPTFDAFFALSNFNDEQKEQFNTLPDQLQEQIENRFGFDDVFSLINSKNTTNIYLTSMQIHASKVYQGNVPTPIAYLYTFETGKPIAVAFEPSGENQFTASGYFVLGQDFSSLSKVREVFEPYGCNVEEVSK